MPPLCKWAVPWKFYIQKIPPIYTQAVYSTTVTQCNVIGWSADVRGKYILTQTQTQTQT